MNDALQMDTHVGRRVTLRLKDTTTVDGVLSQEGTYHVVVGESTLVDKRHIVSIEWEPLPVYDDTPTLIGWASVSIIPES